MVLIVGPATVREARKFGEQLPATVEQLYDLPIVGHRLREADAAGQVTKWLEDLPARIDTSDIVSLAETLVGGAAATLTVVVFVLAILLDGEVLVAPGSGTSSRSTAGPAPTALARSSTPRSATTSPARSSWRCSTAPWCSCSG